MDNYLRIINTLGKRLGESFTMRELSAMTKIPYATMHRTLKAMGGLVETRPVGRATTVALRKEHPTMRSYLAVSSEEEKLDFLKGQPIIAKIAAELDTQDAVLLFGSYAKGTQRESSDIDLLVINKDGKRTISLTKYETLFGKRINPIFVTRKEFAAMLGEPDENVGKQALKDHILLNNPEDFWTVALHA